MNRSGWNLQEMFDLARKGRALALTVALFASVSGKIDAADLRIVAPNAVKEIATHAAASYERSSGNRVVFTWGGSEAIAKRISDGEVFDVVLNTPQNLDRLVAAGKILPGTRTDFAKSGIGIAVHAGQPRPDVSNENALRKALLEAKTIGISSGPSGRYLTELFQRLGVRNEIEGKIRQPPSGAQIAELIARGDVELGFQQISELQHASGVEYLGPLPADLQSYTIWSAGLPSGVSDTTAGRVFLQELKSPEEASVIRNAGMEPL